jgi:hypothetical protein
MLKNENNDAQITFEYESLIPLPPKICQTFLPQVSKDRSQIEEDRWKITR